MMTTGTTQGVRRPPSLSKIVLLERGDSSDASWRDAGPHLTADEEAILRQSLIELLEDDLDEMPTMPTAELGVPIDLAREDLDDGEDDLGFRALYEYPDPLLKRAR